MQKLHVPVHCGKVLTVTSSWQCVVKVQLTVALVEVLFLLLSSVESILVISEVNFVEAKALSMDTHTHTHTLFPSLSFPRCVGGGG